MLNQLKSMEADLKEKQDEFEAELAKQLKDVKDVVTKMHTEIEEEFQRQMDQFRLAIEHRQADMKAQLEKIRNNTIGQLNKMKESMGKRITAMSQAMGKKCKDWTAEVKIQTALVKVASKQKKGDSRRKGVPPKLDSMPEKNQVTCSEVGLEVTSEDDPDDCRAGKSIRRIDHCSVSVTVIAEY